MTPYTTYVEVRTHHNIVFKSSGLSCVLLLTRRQLFLLLKVSRKYDLLSTLQPLEYQHKQYSNTNIVIKRYAVMIYIMGIHVQLITS